jgi:hypothetical protein
LASPFRNFAAFYPKAKPRTIVLPLMGGKGVLGHDLRHSALALAVGFTCGI